MKKILLGVLLAGCLVMGLLIGGKFLFPDFRRVIQNTIAILEEEIKNAEPSEVPVLIETRDYFKEALGIWEKEKGAERKELRKEILMVRSSLLDSLRLKRQFKEGEGILKEVLETARRLREEREKLIEEMEGFEE